MLRFFLLFVLLGSAGRGQDFIIADFRTSEGDFSVSLDYVNAPLAVANFIHLAGKGDDIFETPDNAPALNTVAHYRQSFYRTTRESDTQRIPLRVDFIPASSLNVAYYGIFQGATFIGAVEEKLVDRPYHRDITGQDRIRLQLVGGDPRRYRITLRYPRPWLDARDQWVKEAPMYRGLPIQRVESGKRFFAGSMTRDPFENPGYEFQDEVVRNFGSISDPFGSPFNQAWVIAMDSVAPNRNGSRFFITSAPDRSLNGRHTAFGRVVQNAGRSVVQSIANAVTDEDDQPNTAMFIQEIQIRRGGLTAEAFFEGFHQATIPGEIVPLSLSLERNEGRLFLRQSAEPSSQITLFSNSELRGQGAGFLMARSPDQLEDELTDLTQVRSLRPRVFFRGFATRVPFWPSADVDFNGAQFTFNVTSEGGFGALNLVFPRTQGGGLAGGTYSLNMNIERRELGEETVVESASGSGAFFATYDSSQGPYRGVLKFSNITGPLNIDELTLHLDADRFVGTPGSREDLVIRRFDARRTDPEKKFLSYGGLYRKLQ